MCDADRAPVVAFLKLCDEAGPYADRKIRAILARRGNMSAKFRNRTLASGAVGIGSELRPQQNKKIDIRIKSYKS